MIMSNTTQVLNLPVARPSVRNLVVGLLLGSTEIKEQTTAGHLALVAIGDRGIRSAA